MGRERIVEAALEVMNAHGLSGVTVRRIAETLGVQPAALYRHVSNKQELLDQMDAALIAEEPALAETAAATGGAGWTELVAARSRAMRRAFLRRRDGALLHATAHPTSGSAEAIERQRVAMSEAGFTHDEIVATLFAVTQFTVGSALEQQQASPGRADFFERVYEHGLNALLYGLDARTSSVRLPAGPSLDRPAGAGGAPSERNTEAMPRNEATHSP